MRSYKSCFKKLHRACFITAICQFGISLLGFLLLCVTYTQIKLPDLSSTDKEQFLTNFQKYLILSSAMSFLLILLLSFVLGLGIIYESYKITLVWTISALLASVLIILGHLAAGIYLIIEGLYVVGIPSVLISIVILVFMGHSVLIMYYLCQDFQSKSQIREDRNSN